MSKKKEPKRLVRLCPRCNSGNIETDYSNIGAIITGTFQDQMRCRNCGYTGTFFPIVDPQQAGPVKKPKDVLKR